MIVLHQTANESLLHTFKSIQTVATLKFIRDDSKTFVDICSHMLRQNVIPG